jgi:hypothetical protein
MNKIAIEAKRDFLERLASAPPLKAVGELIWNGLDAGAEKVEIRLVTNILDGLEEIRVRDDGGGINHAQIQALFGNLGASWKMKKNRYRGRSLHGKSGQGRFKAFALGDRVEWNTVYEDSGSRFRFQITGRATALDDLRFSEPSPANGDACGTEVVISEIQKSFGSLLGDKAAEELAKHFAVFLSQYPEVEILYDGTVVDPATIQNHKQDLPLDEIQLSNGQKISAAVTVVEWSVPTKRVIHLCDADGVSLHEAEAGVQVRAPGFEFTAYVKSDLFRELDKQGQLCLDELNPDVSRVLQQAKQRIKGYFRQRLAEQQSQIIARWKSEHIYPFEDKTEIDPVENAERQVFDIVAVNVEAYLPAFEQSDAKSKRFMFRLLAQALRQNPESVQQILTEVLNLKKEEQEDLAELLEKTPLSAIITSAKTVANRLDFLVGLENLLFDKETKKKLLERDQLHKILETEAWIFDENFALSGSEERLEEVLKLHLGELGARVDETGPVLVEGDKQGRVDLILSRVTQPRHDEKDHLVVELKRPSQPINSKILGQVESYAIAVAKDPRFLKEKTRWRFIVVSDELDEHAKRKARQRDKPPGLVFDDAELNIQVWAYEWTEIIANAKARLQFINASLSYEANRESSKAYLQKAHAKFIPQAEAAESEDADEDAAPPNQP